MMTIASGGGDYDDYCLRWSTTKQPTRALLRHPSKSDHFPAKPKVTRIKIIIHHCQIHDIYVFTNAHDLSFPRHQFSGSPPPWRTLLTHGQPLVQVVHRDVDVLRMNLILVMLMTLIIVIVTIVVVLIMI